MPNNDDDDDTCFDTPTKTINARFANVNISQGSVATHLRWGGIFINSVIANSNWVCWWKNYENRSIFSKDMDKNIVSPFFDSRCTYVCLCVWLSGVFKKSRPVLATYMAIQLYRANNDSVVARRTNCRISYVVNCQHVQCHFRQVCRDVSRCVRKYALSVYFMYLFIYWNTQQRTWLVSSNGRHTQHLSGPNPLHQFPCSKSVTS